MSSRILCLLAITAIFNAGLCPVCAGKTTQPAVAKANHQSLFETVALENNYGKKVSLADFQNAKVVVLAFLGTECPMAKLYGPTLSRLQDEFKGRDVQFLGISSNKQDSLTELTAYVNRYKLSFPMLKDLGNKVADKLGAKRTPEVFVLDSERNVCYQGRIDDQYGVGYAREKAQKTELRDAIVELLDGKPVSKPKTNALGCIIGRVKETKSTGDITYTKDVAAILNSRCVECHREGEIGPFALESYDDVQGWEDMILEVVSENRMPPWNANPAHGVFANDARLSSEEKATLREWVENGMPEGDAKDLPEPPKFADGWKIPKPDEIFQMADKPFTVPAQGIVDYQRFIVDPKWEEDKYVYAAEARPQNRAVVHHILVYIIPPGSRRVDLEKVLVGYAPGSLPIHYKDGLAIKVEAGSKFLFEMHYTPNGTEQTDLSYAGVCFADEEDVERTVRGFVVATRDWEIGPGDANKEVTESRRVRRDQLLISMTPHMHLRGKSFRYEAFYPGKSEPEVLLEVPKYDFNWQLKYILETPKFIPKGTKIVCTAVYDNSADNPVNPNPNRTVTWGDQSFDEMMIGFADMVDPGTE
ncbi:MAG: redoxin domain-containing protein [Aureliella sp.]